MFEVPSTAIVRYLIQCCCVSDRRQCPGGEARESSTNSASKGRVRTIHYVLLLIRANDYCQIGSGLATFAVTVTALGEPGVMGIATGSSLIGPLVAPTERFPVRVIHLPGVGPAIIAEFDRRRSRSPAP